MRWWPGRRRDADLERELEADLELEEEEQRERGVPADEARYAARRAFGNPTLIKEQTREAWGWGPVERLWRDVRYGLRQLARNPGFTAVAVMTLALGVGVNTTIFSAVSAILLRKPPVKNPDTLCTISSKNILRGYDLAGVSAPDFKSWQKQNDVFKQMAAAELWRSFTLTGKANPEQVHGDLVTQDYFSVIGVMPALGRTFLESESEPGKNHVVILSDSLWRERFHSNLDVLGKDLIADGRSYQIVGVMPRLSVLTMRAQPQLWMPLVIGGDDLKPAARGNHYINLVLGRLKPGVKIARAQAEMDTIGRRLAQEYPTTDKGWGVTVLTLQEYNIRSQGVRNAMLLLMVIVGLVLLVACANIAGLLLTRGACRAHEFAVRSALGASRARMLRQMLVENALLGVASGAAGLLISFGGVRLLRASFAFDAYGARVGSGFRVDVPTLLFTLGITLATTILFGVLPAVRSSKTAPQGALSQTGRTASGGKESTRLRRVLVVAEVAAAVILLAAAGVFLRDFIREVKESNGFNPHHLLIANLNVSSARYKEAGTRRAFYQQVVQKVRSLPGVESADVDSCIPMGCYYGLSFDISGQPAQSPAMRPSSYFFVVGPDYFRTMQIPVLRGRGLSRDDNSQTPVVAVVNQEFARRFFPHEDVIGKQVEIHDGNHKRAEIVGVVGSVNNYVGQLRPEPQIYESYMQVPFHAFSSMEVVVRSNVPRAELAAMLRKTVWSVDKTQPVGITSMEDLVNDSFGGDKLMVELMGLFAALALGLAGLGIYGVIAYSVAQRTHEIGIRMALGAERKNVLGLILREGGVLIGIGCTAGSVAALFLPKLIRGLLNGIAPQGPLAALTAAAIVILVSFLAIYVPAYRAMHVDPMGALRAE